MLIRWIIGFQRELGEPKSRMPLRKAHLELIGFSQAGPANFYYKYCALMIDIADGEGTDEAKQMHFQCGARRREGRSNRGDGWCLVLSEWTIWSRTGEGEKTCPLGNHKTPPLIYSPPQNQHHGSQQHGLILTRSHQLLCGSLFSTVKPSNCLWEPLWLFELFIRIICCPSRPFFSFSSAGP